MGFFNKIINKLQGFNRELYYKEAGGQESNIASPEQLYAIEQELDEINDDIYSSVGGRENINIMIDWGNRNLSAQEMENFFKPFNDMIERVGYCNIQVGDKLRGEHISEDAVQKCKDSCFYLKALYNNR
jgi:hypothetical protein